MIYDNLNVEALHSRVASCLGWSVADCGTFSLLALAAFVREKDKGLEEDIRECVRLGQHIVARPRMDREAKRCDLIAEYNRVSDAAVRGPGFTSHTEKRLRLLRAKIEKLGGFKV